MMCRREVSNGEPAEKAVEPTLLSSFCRSNERNIMPNAIKGEKRKTTFRSARMALQTKSLALMKRNWISSTSRFRLSNCHFYTFGMGRLRPPMALQMGSNVRGEYIHPTAMSRRGLQSNLRRQYDVKLSKPFQGTAELRKQRR